MTWSSEIRITHNERGRTRQVYKGESEEKMLVEEVRQMSSEQQLRRFEAEDEEKRE